VGCAQIIHYCLCGWLCVGGPGGGSRCWTRLFGGGLLSVRRPGAPWPRQVIITLGRTSGQRCWSEPWTDSRHAQAWRGAEPGCGQDPANRSLADAVAQAQEFTLDAPCPTAGSAWPATGSACRSHRDRRASGCVRAGPFVPDQAPVPGEQGAGRHDPVQQASGQRSRRGQPCPASCARPGGAKTGTSSCGTRISASFEAPLRARSASQPDNRTMSR
jgi:hypothetical protein